MSEYMHHEYDYSDIPENKQTEIADIFDDNGEYMKKHTIGQIRSLAKEYYDSEAIMNMPEHKEQDHSEYLYTIIKYGNEDVLLHIGTGKFTPEMFTTGNIPEYAWLYRSPLKLFVTNAWARSQDNESSPKDFLAQHAKLYSPKWWVVEIRNIHDISPINYGNSLGIVYYDDSIVALQNAQIQKSFSQENFKKFCEKIERLKECSYDDIVKQSKTKEGFHYLSDEDKAFNQAFFDCLLSLSGGNKKNMYKLIKSFDSATQKFVAPAHKKNIY